MDQHKIVLRVPNSDRIYVSNSSILSVLARNLTSTIKVNNCLNGSLNTAVFMILTGNWQYQTLNGATNLTPQPVHYTLHLPIGLLLPHCELNTQQNHDCLVSLVKKMMSNKPPSTLVTCSTCSLAFLSKLYLPDSCCFGFVPSWLNDLSVRRFG